MCWNLRLCSSGTDTCLPWLLIWSLRLPWRDAGRSDKEAADTERVARFYEVADGVDVPASLDMGEKPRALTF